MAKEAKDCVVIGCGKPHYALGYCRNHYTLFKRTGNPIGLYINHCQWVDCKVKTQGVSFCYDHQKAYDLRFKYNLPLDTKDCRPTACKQKMLGPNNPRWNKGASTYKSSADMKRSRLTKLAQTNATCERCGIQGSGHKIQIHHKDRSKSNHSISNLTVLCPKCHRKEHPKKKRPARVSM